MRAALGIAVLAAGLGLAGVAAKIGQPERAVSGPSIRARPSGDEPASPPPNEPIVAGPTVPAPVDDPQVPATVTISGVVVDDLGQPVRDAALIEFQPSRHHCTGYWFTEVDGEGRFSVEASIQGGYARRLGFANARGFIDADLRARPEQMGALERGGVIDGIRVVLYREATVIGTVRRPDGEAVPFACVEWGTGELPEDLFFRTTHASEVGEYRIDGLHAAEDVRLRSSAWGSTSGEVRLLGLLRAGEAVRRDVVLTDPSGEDPEMDGFWAIEGTVTDAEGRPLEGVRVRGPLFGRAAGVGSAVTSDGDGKFRGVLQAFEPGYRRGRRLEAVQSGYAPLLYDLTDECVAQLQARRDVSDVRLVLRPGGAVRGRVLDPAGHPVPDATVRVIEEAGGDRNPSWIRQERTWSDGSFEIPDLDPNADWWLLADKEARTSHYVSLRGRLRIGETAELDIPFPSTREVAIEVVVRNWVPGMWLATDCIGAKLDSEIKNLKKCAGPHKFTLCDAADHPIAFAESDIPYDAESWCVEIEAKPCTECAKGVTPKGK